MIAKLYSGFRQEVHPAQFRHAKSPLVQLQINFNDCVITGGLQIRSRPGKKCVLNFEPLKLVGHFCVPLLMIPLLFERFFFFLFLLSFLSRQDMILTKVDPSSKWEFWTGTAVSLFCRVRFGSSGVSHTLRLYFIMLLWGKFQVHDLDTTALAYIGKECRRN